MMHVTNCKHSWQALQEAAQYKNLHSQLAEPLNTITALCYLRKEIRMFGHCAWQ